MSRIQSPELQTIKEGLAPAYLLMHWYLVATVSQRGSHLFPQQEHERMIFHRV